MGEGEGGVRGGVKGGDGSGGERVREKVLTGNSVLEFSTLSIPSSELWIWSTCTSFISCPLCSGFFFYVPGGPITAPVPMKNTLSFSQFDKKKLPSQKTKFCSCQQLFDFLSSDCSFFHTYSQNRRSSANI